MLYSLVGVYSEVRMTDAEGHCKELFILHGVRTYNTTFGATNAMTALKLIYNWCLRDACCFHLKG
jgi:hypothetical protein